MDCASCFYVSYPYITTKFIIIILYDCLDVLSVYQVRTSPIIWSTLYVEFEIGQIPASSQCQPSTCGSPVAPCSSNLDCECLALSTGGGGICAALLSCSSLTPCSSDNVTCVVPYTVCVVKTRCNKPMCYPIALAVSQVCPPLNSTATTLMVPTSAGICQWNILNSE